MLEIKNMTKKIGSKIILKNINLAIKKGEIAVLLGQNGSGKTTLIKCISGISFFKKGSINYFNKKVGVSLNEKNLLIQKLTVSEYLRFVCVLNDIETHKINSSIENLLSFFLMINDKNKLIYKLSKGGIAKLSLISALIINPDIILLDEPFSGMDILAIESTKKILIKKKKQGCTILISTHNVALLQELYDQVLILKNKSIQKVSKSKTAEYIISLIT